MATENPELVRVLLKGQGPMPGDQLSALLKPHEASELVFKGDGELDPDCG